MTTDDIDHTIERSGEEEQLKLETLDDDFKILLEKTEYL
jgi:hypothetical protein